MAAVSEASLTRHCSRRLRGVVEFAFAVACRFALAVARSASLANSSELVCGGAKEPRRWFGPAVEAAKLSGFTWHCLRHTFANRLVMAGVDIRTVQELLGYKTISMTVR
jgi:integrase